MNKIELDRLVHLYNFSKELLILGEDDESVYPVDFMPSTFIVHNALVKSGKYIQTIDNVGTSTITLTNTQTFFCEKNSFVNITSLFAAAKKLSTGIQADPYYNYKLVMIPEKNLIQEITAIQKSDSFINLEEFLKDIHWKTQEVVQIKQPMQLFQCKEVDGMKIATTYFNGIGLNKKQTIVNGVLIEPGKALIFNTGDRKPMSYQSNYVCDFSLSWGHFEKSKPKKYTTNLIKSFDR